MFRACIRTSTTITITTTTTTTTRRQQQAVLLSPGKCSPRLPFLALTTTTSTTTLRRHLSSNTSNSSSSGQQKFQNEAERTAFLRQANATMEQYHNARQLMKKGKLPRHASHPANQAGASSFGSSSNNNAGTIQMAVVGVFLVAFLATPYLGKRIAQDKEFRKKYIPAWYDFTVQQVPDSAWTREELHEQRLQVEQTLRRRAAAGDFETEKLQALQKAMSASGNDNAGAAASNSTTTAAAVLVELTPDEQRHAVWDKWHPGLADDEKVNEEE